MGTTGDYYSILGIDRGASVHVVRTSYRRLMQKGGNHPDLGGDTKTAALINKAYAVLSDPALRSEYDAKLSVLDHIARGVTMAPAAAPPDPSRACLFCGHPHEYGASDLEEISCHNCGSALQSIDRSRMEPMGKRVVQRLGQCVDLEVFTHWTQKKGFTAKTQDISPYGLRMIARCELTLGQRVHIVGRKLDAVGEVVYVAPGPSTWGRETIAGITFHTLRYDRRVGVFVTRQI